jgi:phage/plasmid-associated DNA primase
MQKSDNNEGIVFSDDDDDYEANDEVKAEVTMRLQENTEGIIRTFKEYMSTPAFINSVNDPTTNIIDRHQKKCYNIPPRNISKFFKFLEISRRKKLKMMMYEKQSEYSGIMLDFDIHLNAGGISPVNHTHFHRLCLAVIRLIFKFIHFSEEDMGQKKNVHVGFIKKPKIVYDNEHDYYKDGFHMLIPGIQITRELKKHIINTLIDEKTLEKIFKEVTPHKSNTRSQFLDENSSHVGVFFVGSASKINTPPYELTDVYNVQTTIGEPDDIIPVKEANFKNEVNTNICYEFSLNWGRSLDKGGVIEKKKYDAKTEYQNIINQYKTSVAAVEDEFDGDECKYYNDMSILNLHDPDMEYIKVLLDILHPIRSEKYEHWFNVLCALAHTSKSYKPLAEYFSRKSPERFDAVAFDRIWDSILSKKNICLSMGSIHYWAKLDNPDRYEEVKHRSIFTLLYKKIYAPEIEGNLEHFDVAEILYQVLKNKYCVDYDCGVETWYEFILEDEPMVTGELYKWRAYNHKPKSLLKYMSAILPILFIKILDRIKSTLDECNTDLAKYHYHIYKNFQKSTRTLKNSGFKQAVMTECGQLFERLGFSKKLDASPDLKGVSNGILKLGTKCELVQGYHGYLVSKYTEATFKYFNPHDNNTKKVLIALRNLFPDDEPDTFDYIMHYLASTLDGHKKESIMMLLVGKGSNGKSFMVELHKGAIGDTYGVKMPLSFLTSRSKDAESATPALMQLKDAHFAYYSESNKFEILNMAKIKEFTGQETLAGRKLHSDYVNFKPKCHHLVASNNDFEVQGTDHGTWRRLDYVTMKIKFCAANDEYDEKNPFERKADPNMGSNWAEDEEILASYLGILTYYYESLYKNYGGKVRNVPHPHILQETEEFRNRQDRVNNFLNMKLVKCPDPESEMSIAIIKARYIAWYESNYPGAGKEYQRVAIDQLENSKIQKFIKKSRRGNFLKGYRILDLSEEKEDDEEFYTDLFEKLSKSTVDIKKESALQYHTRLCKDYDTKTFTEKSCDFKDIEKSYEIINDVSETGDSTTRIKDVELFTKFRDMPDKGKKSGYDFSDDSDSDIEDLIIDNRKRLPKKEIKVNDIKVDLDSNGIRVKKKIIPTVSKFVLMHNSDNEDDSDKTDVDSD